MIDYLWTRSGPIKIVVRVSGEAQITLANFSAGTSEQKERIGRARTKWRRNGARAQTFNGQIYNRPFARNRVTGSTTGTASRLKIQRATAKPIAA